MPEYRSRQERRKAQAKGRNKRKKRGLLKKIFLAFCLFIALLIIGGGIAVFAIIQNAPDLNPALLDSPQTTIIFDKEGKPVSKLYKQNRIKVDIGDVPKLQQEAVTSIEDRRFYKHFGIDIHRILGAAVEDIKKGRFAEGGSTITQQVVKRSFLTSKKTFVRKIQEAWLAIKLEQKYSKEQILDMYLNKIYYGEGAYGIATASETYFGTKDLSKLNLSQMALLAGLPNAPSAYDPYTHPEKAAERRNQVLNAMVETGAIDERQAQKAKSIPIKDLIVKKKKDDKNDDDAAYQAFVDTVYRELVKEKNIVSEKDFFQGGLKIYTTLDKDAQKEVYHLIHSDEINYPDKYFETGLALIDTQTGAVRAVGGGRDFKAITYTNYGSQVKNPTGSTMKPVIDYGPAIEHLKWSTAHILEDEPYTYQDENHKPIHDWDGRYMGSMTLRDALAYSRNIPALKTMYAVGKDKAVNFAENLGLDFQKPVYDPVAIGSYEPGATPLQMAGAYAAFGNEGVYNEPYTVTKIVFPDGKTIKPEHQSHTAMHDYTAYMITDVLKSVIDYGTGKDISLPGLPVAGKTGSVGLGEDFRKKHGITDTNGYSDEWFNGYTTQYTASIWTGYPSLTADGKVHYMSTAASKDIAKQIFEKLMANVSSDNVQDWQQPDSVINLNGELYVKGTQSAKEEIEKNAKLDAPTNLQAQYDKDNNQISLSWDYSDDDVKFKVEASVDGKPLQTIDTGDKQTTVDDPKPGATYSFRVTAMKDDKESDPAEASVKVPGEEDQNGKPETPQGLQAVYDENNQLISVTWGYPDGQQNIAFKVSYSIDGGSMQTLSTTQSNQAVINSPKPGATYSFQVTAVKDNKESDPAEASVKVPGEEDQNGKPEAPQGLQAVYDENNQLISVTWGYPDGQQNTAFKVSYSIDGGSMQTLSTTQSNQAVINNPKPGATYSFQVTAVKDNKESDPVTTTVKVPDDNAPPTNGSRDSKQ